jgi:hypothetical protein
MRKLTTSVPLEISSQLDKLTEELGEIGVSYIGHGVVDTQGNHTGYFSNASWKESYLGNSFFHNEPILDVFALRPFEPVCWDTLNDNKVALMRKERLSLSGGVTTASFHQTAFGFLNIGFSDGQNAQEFLDAYRPLIEAYHQAYDRIHMSWRTLG